MICVKKSSRTVTGANPGELGDLGKDGALSRLKVGAPNVGIIPVTRLQNHSRTVRATTLEIHLTPGADVDETGKITRRRTKRDIL
jgi:hypothetical protein